MRLRSSPLVTTLLVLGACIPDAIIESASDSKGSSESSTGDGDGDPATASATDSMGDGDGDTAGDGDGDADTVGDGDGDTNTGDGDGDTDTGDGDGDTGDGDGDGEPGPDVCSSVRFAEDGDLALVGLAPGLDFGPQDAFTIATWAYLNGNAADEDGYLLAKGDANTNEWSLTSVADTLCFNQEGVGAILCTKVSIQSWHHYALVYMGEAVRIYQDGVLLDSASGPIGEPAASALYIGARDGQGGPLNGHIDDLAVWSTSLSEAQLGQLASDSAVAWDVANDNLVGWWRFGEGAGNIIADDSGSGLSANLQASRWSLACHGGVCSSMELDQKNDGVQVPADPALDYGPGDDFSVGLWAYLYGKDSHIVVKGDNNSNEWSLTWTALDGLCLNRQGQAVLACGPAPFAGWHHYGFSHAAGQIALYADGEQIGSAAGMIGASQQTALKLGYIDNNNVLDGVFDDVALFSAVLSQPEFAALAARASAPDDFGSLEGWWGFNEGNALVVGDASANANQGSVLDGDWLDICAP